MLFFASALFQSSADLLLLISEYLVIVQMWFAFSCSLCYCDYQVAELQEELIQLRDQKAQLEKELDTQTTETQKQVEKH